MRQDSIVEETHRVRREIAAEFHGDIHALFEYLRGRERKRNDEVEVLQPIAPEASREKCK